MAWAVTRGYPPTVLAQPLPERDGLAPKAAGRPSPRRAAAFVLLLLAAGAAVALAASLIFTPEQIAGGQHFAWLGWVPPPCTGCALCGASRAFASASRLDLAGALALNPLVALLYPTALTLALAGPWLALHLLRRP